MGWGAGGLWCKRSQGSGFFAVLYFSSSYLGAVSLVHTGAFPCRCMWLSNLRSEHIWVQAWSNGMVCCNGLSFTLVSSDLVCASAIWLEWYPGLWSPAFATEPRGYYLSNPFPSSSLVSCPAKFPCDYVFTMGITALWNLNFRFFLHLVASCS